MFIAFTQKKKKKKGSFLAYAVLYKEKCTLNLSKIKSTRCLLVVLMRFKYSYPGRYNDQQLKPSSSPVSDFLSLNYSHFSHPKTLFFLLS